MPSFLRGNQPGSVDEPSLFANAEIVFMKQIGTDYLLVNSQGIVMMMNQQGDITKAVSIVTPDE